AGRTDHDAHHSDAPLRSEPATARVPRGAVKTAGRRWDGEAAAPHYCSLPGRWRLGSLGGRVVVNRAEMLRCAVDRREAWDLVVVGGGATGAGIAVDAAARGYAVLLLERSDFGAGTSSRSTKLVHGGVRYLRQGHVGLVLEALRERGRLLRNAPHLVHDLAFVLPCYRRREVAFYGVGMKAYDLLAAWGGFGRSKIVSAAEVRRRLPTVRSAGLRGGVVYHDGQFDDARLLVDLIRTAAGLGATV